MKAPFELMHTDIAEKCFCVKVKDNFTRYKITSTSTRSDPKKFISKSMANVNNIQSQNFGYPPEGIEENAIQKLKI